jgi:hypothetical protein
MRPLRWLAPLALPLLAHAQHGAHQHGVAQLDIAVESRSISVQFASPLDNLLGFERAPRTEAEKTQAGAAVARLEAGAQLLRVDPAAGCRLAGVELVSAALKLGPAEAAPSRAEHADLEARYRFDCTDAARAAWIDVGLFDFKRLVRLQVQLATPKGQFRRDLERPAVRIVLGR